MPDNNHLINHMFMWRWVMLMITIAGNQPTLERMIDQAGVVIDYSHGVEKDKNKKKKGRLVCSSLSFFITEEIFST